MPTRPFPGSLRRLGEFGLIERFKRRASQTSPSVLRGIGDDDTAVIRMRSGQLLLLTTDLLAEGVHFELATAKPGDIGYKAAVSNLSDIAAMGGVPEYMVVALAIPGSYTIAQLDDLFQGVIRACRRHGVQLVGGDTSASRGGLFICITVTGTSRVGRPLTRAGARVGDLLYVTGTLGDSFAGLNILKTSGARTRFSATSHDGRHLRYLIGRHLRPTARLREGQLLAAHRLATAAMDLSDGLSGDLHHLCKQSGVGAEVEAAALPLSAACRWYAATRHIDPADFALAGGEDYELLFTVSPDDRDTLARLVRRIGFPCTRIGTIRPKTSGIRVTPRTGRSRFLTPMSYQHFRQPATPGKTSVP